MMNDNGFCKIVQLHTKKTCTYLHGLSYLNNNDNDNSYNDYYLHIQGNILPDAKVWKIF